MTTPLKRLRLGVVALIGFAACAPSRPPFTEPPGARAPADPREAAIVFLWPSTSCDPAGYFTLATADGQFLGNISRDSRLSVLVPSGERTIVAWNSLVEATSGSMSSETVPVLHADLDEGRTYYVRMAFGEWNASGPAEVWGGRKGNGDITHACLKVPESATSAMVVLSPTREGWNDLPDWLTTLEDIVPARAAGQAWLDRNRGLLESHVVMGQERFAGLRPQAKRLATLELADSAPR